MDISDNVSYSDFFSLYIDSNNNQNILKTYDNKNTQTKVSYTIGTISAYEYQLKHNSINNEFERFLPNTYMHGYKIYILARLYYVRDIILTERFIFLLIIFILIFFI